VANGRRSPSAPNPFMAHSDLGFYHPEDDGSAGRSLRAGQGGGDEVPTPSIGAVRDQDTARAVSSITNEVGSELSSMLVNLSVTVWPMNCLRMRVCWTYPAAASRLE
jgi:hypothetical protein